MQPTVRRMRGNLVADNSNKPRLVFIDILRGLAVLLMMEQNIGIWLWRPDGPMRFFNHPFLFSLNGIGGFAGPLFITLAGVSGALFVRRYKDPDRTLVLRGAVVMSFGYLMNFLTPGFFSMGSWFTLHMIGFAIVLTPLFRRLSDLQILLLALTVTLGTGLVHLWLDTPRILTEYHMRSPDRPGGMFRLMFAEGHYPVFPWLAFFLGGFLAGRLFAAGQQRRMLHIAFAALALSLVLMIPALPGIGLADPNTLHRFLSLNIGSFPTPPLFVLLFYPLVIFALLLARAATARLGLTHRHFLASLGHISLTLQIVHVVIFYEVFQRIRWFRTFSTVETLVILATVLSITAFLAVCWRRYDFKFGCEWLLRRVTAGSAEKRVSEPHKAVKKVLG